MASAISTGNAVSSLEKISFSTSVVSSAPNIPKPSINECPVTPTQNAIVNKFLSLGKSDTSYSSESSSSVSSTPSTDSPAKLRDLPHTDTLSGCVAFVDVWSFGGTDNRSSVFRNSLTRMGATVCKKFTKEYQITHVVFKDGHKSVLQKAQKRNIKIVTCLWVERCRVLQKWVNEEEYIFDPTSYKPPKRFYEMQPQDPEESMRRSAERIKRRKARHAKKAAKIMFQSPLVTHNYSGTPRGLEPQDHCNIQTTELVNQRNGIMVADTPYQPHSRFLMFNPSIVFETPLSDSMKRKMQRYKEGKRVFSPPSSDNEDDDKPNSLSPDRPTETSSSVSNLNTKSSELDEKSFSPIADTQFPSKKIWLKSGISPPKLNLSCDEIPETQTLVSPLEVNCATQYEADHGLLAKTIQSESLSNDTIHIHEDMELTAIVHGVKTTSSSPCSSADVTSHSSKTMSISSCSQTSLNLHVSGNSSISFNESEAKDNTLSAYDDQSIKKVDENTKEENKSKPAKPMKKRRMLLRNDEYVEPISLLLSPKSSATKSEDPKRNNLNEIAQNSICLPQLGCSAYKTLTQTGKFFQPLPSETKSDSSLNSSKMTSPCQIKSQRTDHDLKNPHTNDVPLSNDSFCLYDRIKMRKKRASSDVGRGSFLFQSSSLKKRRRKDSEPTNEVSKAPKLENLNKVLFCSQAALSILSSLKKRRSTNEFKTPMSGFEEIGKLHKKKQKKKVIVLTNLHSDERMETQKSIRRLSQSRLSSTVRDQTTHVVCGAPRRTMNVLRAIARGLWLLSKNWVLDSHSSGFWLEEEAYEIQNLFPVAKKNRLKRSRNPMWMNTVFEGVKGHIYVTDDTRPPQEELKELITLCGGSVVGSARRASLCIGNPERIIPLIPVVNETWVIDCICEDTLLPYSSYLID